MGTVELALRSLGQDIPVVIGVRGASLLAEASIGREGFLFDFIGRMGDTNISVFVLPGQDRMMMFNYADAGLKGTVGGTIKMSVSGINGLLGQLREIKLSTSVKKEDLVKTLWIISKEIGSPDTSEEKGGFLARAKMAGFIGAAAAAVERVELRPRIRPREEQKEQRLEKKSLLEYGKKGRIIANLAGVDTIPGFVRTYIGERLKIEALRHQVCFSVDGDQVFAVSEVSESVIPATNDQALMIRCLDLIDSAYSMAGRLQRSDRSSWL